MELVAAHYPEKFSIPNAESLREIVELLLLRGETKWLAKFVDSRILLWEEVERIFKAKHFNQVNRERIELQGAALPFFRGILGTSIGRVSTDPATAAYMIFTLAKNEEWLVLISAAVNVSEFMGDDLEAKDILKAKICLRLCSSASIDEQTCRIFLRSVTFSTQGSLVRKAEQEVKRWLSEHLLQVAGAGAILG
jgi:hypothetical protein